MRTKLTTREIILHHTCAHTDTNHTQASAQIRMTMQNFKILIRRAQTDTDKRHTHLTQESVQHTRHTHIPNDSMYVC